MFAFCIYPFEIHVVKHSNLRLMNCSQKQHQSQSSDLAYMMNIKIQNKIVFFFQEKKIEKVKERERRNTNNGKYK